MKNTNYRPVEVLLVEDNKDDVFLTLNAFDCSKVKNNVNVVSDGSSALRYLRGKGEYKQAVRPDIILMDLKMPRMDGHEALSEIKKDPALENIPVVILTASKAREDVEKGYNLKANCCITKPLRGRDFRELLENVLNFLVNAVPLPAEIKLGDKPEKK